MNDIDALLNSQTAAPAADTTFIGQLVSAVVLGTTIFGLVMLVAMVFWLYRAWKVQTAMLQMQKDIESIKQTLAANVQPRDTPKS